MDFYFGIDLLQQLRQYYEGRLSLPLAKGFDQQDAKYSVEDKGAGVSYCVFAYNVQPGIEIDYATGESKLADGAQHEEQKTATVTPTPSPEPEKQEPVNGSEASQADYILNTNTKKFHYTTCSSVNDMKEKNKQEFFGTRDEAISNGYSPCGCCKP